ncbi:hypothetical protein BDA96_07G017800 [Sorghum bicolor]|uniref:Uncharacterized protein n=1 Tax=Sorghum bicolor TaxID=4558 RepID=A0A921QHX7_SORBI|nr:hypothetical protein BDA96_07G017800 [Sorghum bicolor]
MKVESSGIAVEVVFMYQARVDAVKVYYKDVLNQTLDDKLARPIELIYEQYLNGRVKWCKRVAWPSLCRHWCSEEFLTKRKRGQESRLSSDDIAQNRGGSRPFGETRQLLGEKFGPESATDMNTFKVMKCGMKNVDDTGRPGTISNRKAQKIVDEYTAKSQAAHPEGLEQQELDGKILYDLSGALRHGRVAIANGAVKLADVRAAAKRKNPASSNVASYRRMAKDNRNLRHANRCLQERLNQMGELNNDLILDLYRKLDQEVPENHKRRLAALQAKLSTSSSHVDEDLDGEDMDGEDEEDMDGSYMEGEDTDEDMNEEMYEEDEGDEEDRDEEDIDDNNGASNAGSNIDDFCDLGYIW